MQPLLFSVKSIIARALQQEPICLSKLDPEVKEIMKYAVQIPALTTLNLQPLINLKTCCETADSQKVILYYFVTFVGKKL